MKRIGITFFAILFAIAGCGDDGTSSNGVIMDSEFASANMGGNRGLPGKATVLRLFGTGEAYGGTVPDIDGDGAVDSATCFDVDLYDGTGKKIGTATDCLSMITPVGDGLALIGTTIFHLPNGTFVSRGNTSVQPITVSVATPATHVTGAIPIDGSNGVLSGTGAYEGFTAQVRLSGAVDMSKLDSDGLITFDCLFAISPL
ncbi:MAG: hypothetical protein OEV49_06580 [candidate division Zixibacteria bacterium]|nr:hypothetical protein [candidate division Zixibacteria bacterium]MDH3935888.1 hypothetical protein [candidate division Zixibacteria bacterium]MDH4032692.1 hypothetical protein [candidate division Zixibacteria bacterium]